MWGQSCCGHHALKNWSFMLLVVIIFNNVNLGGLRAGLTTRQWHPRPVRGDQQIFRNLQAWGCRYWFFSLNNEFIIKFLIRKGSVFWWSGKAEKGCRWHQIREAKCYFREWRRFLPGQRLVHPFQMGNRRTFRGFSQLYRHGKISFVALFWFAIFYTSNVESGKPRVRRQSRRVRPIFEERQFSCDLRQYGRH